MGEQAERGVVVVVEEEDGEVEDSVEKAGSAGG